eukprot:5824042-Prorocentrum_lima.AAC.1
MLHFLPENMELLMLDAMLDTMLDMPVARSLQSMVSENENVKEKLAILQLEMVGARMRGSTGTENGAVRRTCDVDEE